MIISNCKIQPFKTYASVGFSIFIHKVEKSSALSNSRIFSLPPKPFVPPGSRSLSPAPPSPFPGLSSKFDSQSLWSSVSSFFHFMCFEGSSVLQHVSLFSLFLLITSIFFYYIF